MSDQAEYYRKGLDRGLEEKSTPLSLFNLADKEEEAAAQRGWEAGQSATAHAAQLRSDAEERHEAAGKQDDSDGTADEDTESSSCYDEEPASAVQTVQVPHKKGNHFPDISLKLGVRLPAPPTAEQRI